MASRVLITGSGRGIGSSIAQACSANGAIVIVNYLSRTEDAEATVNKIRSLGRTAVAIQADVRREADVERLIDEATAQYGALDALVNCAHTPFDTTTLEDITWSQCEAQLIGSVQSALNCIQKGIPHLVIPGSSILNISTVTVAAPETGFLHRNIAKAALEGLTRSAAHELSSRGIRVNALSVGWTMTDQAQSFSESYLSTRAAAIPLGRLATPEEIAHVAAFLISPAASFITGTVFPVAGGVSPDFR